MTYRAREGVYETYFQPKHRERSKILEFVRRAIGWSATPTARSEQEAFHSVPPLPPEIGRQRSGYRLLDTFFSDESVDFMLLQEVLLAAKQTEGPVMLLVADAGSPFAAARAGARGHDRCDEDRPETFRNGSAQRVQGAGRARAL
jgi:hypothetical protein